MDLLDFQTSLYEQIRFASSTDGTSDKEEFLTYATDLLLEAEELADDFYYLPFEGVGSKRRKLQIDGYSFNELDDQLSIFISPPMTYEDSATLTNGDAEKLFTKARYFLEDTAYILEYAEESSPGYGFAFDISHKYAQVRKYQIYLITDMQMSTTIRELKNSTVNNRPIEYHIWDINRLHQLTESATGKEDLVIKLQDFGMEGIPCLPASSTEDYTAYLCNIPGTLLAQMYNIYGGRLLEGNVRSFLQTKGKVNKGIRSTILNDPNMFFAYNNGIAATAYEIKTELLNNALHITEFHALQIVNGGQTTASLAMALLNDKRDGSEEKLKEIFVPMKLSVVSPEKAQTLIPNISRYANSQNKVSDADLWSNHPFHIRMEEYSRRITAPATQGRQYGTHWYYERANGQYRQETFKCTDAAKKRFELQNPKQQMFTKTELAKYMNIGRCLPHTASTGGQKSFAEFANWAAQKWVTDEKYFNEDLFKRIVALTIIFRQSDKIVKTQSWYNSYKANIVAYTISKIIYTVKKDYPDYEIDYRAIWQKQELSPTWKAQIECLSKVMYEFLIDDRRPVENVTEWAKRAECWNRAKALKVVLLPEFLKQLAYKARVREQEKDARKEHAESKKVSAMIEVVNYGVDQWKELLAWNKTHNVLNAIDIEFVRVAIAMEKNKFPSEKQCAKILAVLEKARTEAYPK